MNSIKRLDIQYLRALAVISVILFHAYPNTFSNGFLGVDLFFLISGYLIFPQLLKAISVENQSLIRKEIRKFLLRRVKRIAPALGFSISLFMVLGYFFLPPSVDYVNKQILQSTSAIFGFGNLVALRQSGDYFNSDSPFVHFWTLGVEIQTYCLGAILAYFIHRLLKHRTKLSVEKFFYNSLGAVTALSIASRVVTLQFPDVFELLGMQSFAISPSSFDFYFTVNRLWEFSLGGLIALKSSNLDFSSPFLNRLTNQKNYFLLFVSICVLFPTKTLSSNLTVTFLIVTAGIYLALPQETKKDSPLSRVSIWVGDRSYSLYLMHLPLLTMLGGTFIPFSVRPYFTVMAVILTFFLGNISYQLIENRFRKPLKSNVELNSVKTMKSFSLIVISYLIPLTVMSILFFNNSESSNESPPNSAWNMNYAASDSFPCPLGQLDQECKLGGDSKGATWLLVGDSHAGALQKTIKEVAISKGANLSVWNKCRFFDPQISSELNSYFPDWCVRQNAARIKVINSGKVDVLLISYFNSDVNFGEKSLPYFVWAKVFSETLRNLNVKKVFVFSQIPSYADSANDRPRASFPAEEVVPLTFISNMSITERNKDKEMVLSGGAKYIDVTPAYCSNLECVRKDENWLYVDGNHLSIEGAKLMRPILESYFDEDL